MALRDRRQATGYTHRLHHPEDVTDVDPVDVKQNWGLRQLSVIALLLLSTSFTAWLWIVPFQGYRDRKEVEAALELIDRRGTLPTPGKIHRENLEKNPPPTRLYEASNFLKAHAPADQKALFDKAAEAALREAARQGHSLAALDLWKSMRSSGEMSLQTAAKELDRIADLVQTGAKVGDPVSLLTLATMKAEGVGAQFDPDAAVDLATRAAKELPPGLKATLVWDAAWGLGLFKDSANQELAERLAQQLLDEKYFAAPTPCGPSGEIPGEFARCIEEWHKKSALAGDKTRFASLATSLFEDGDSSGAITWFKKTPEDLLAPSDDLIYSFLELVADPASGIPTRLYRVITTRSSANAQDQRPEAWASSITSLAAFLSKADPRNTRNFHQAVVILRALADYDKVPFDVGDGAHFRKTLIDPEGAADALVAALIEKKGINIALKRIETLETPKSMGRTPPAKHLSVDPDFRTKSGPLSEGNSSEGLSSFTVDNTQGSHDVVVRLYRDGKLPAVRSFLVKKGDVYTAEKISAGGYVMRHRNIGSEKTFEANELFELRETPTEAGIRYSRIRVTMYNIRNGNLTNREVASSNF